jgi:hypothetical protein
MTLTHRGTRRTLGLVAAALALGAGTSHAQTLPPARQLVDNYVAAVGGRGALTRFQSRHTVTEMSAPAMGMTMTIELFQARPNRFLSRAEIPGMGTISSGYDGTTAWSINPMQGPQVIQGDPLKAVLQQADFAAAEFPASSFSAMETVGESQVAGRACWNVRLVHSGGSESHSCFDKETGLLIGITMSQATEMGSIPVQVRLEEYRDFDGVRMPTRTVSSVMGQEMTTTVKSVSHAAIADSVFALPAQIRALSGN